MTSRWLEMEHNRLHCVRQWPDSPYKQATLAAILHQLKYLENHPQRNAIAYECPVCKGAALTIAPKNNSTASHPKRRVA